LGWTQAEFDFSEPRYLFNAIRGKIKAEMENARLIGFYCSSIHAAKPLKLQDLGLFSWENPRDYAPKFGPIDKEAFERFRALEFPN
jgi:hypothetical protein